jgi:hypothetical protein
MTIKFDEVEDGGWRLEVGGWKVQDVCTNVAAILTGSNLQSYARYLFLFEAYFISSEQVGSQK